MPKIWFVTGSNRGFGREFAQAALARGDKVAATCRNPDALKDLAAEYGGSILPLRLDVTKRDEVDKAVAAATDQFGRIDVVINNAGYGLFGMVEELTAQQVRDQMEVNFFGLLNVTQAVLPVLREQGHGHIIQISTVCGILAFAGLGGYNASKWAVEGLSEALAQEVAQFGIKVTLVEPGLFGTDWSGSSAVRAEPLAQYDELREATKTRTPTNLIGDPKAAAQAMLKIVDADEPPLRILFGKFPVEIVPAAYEKRLKNWDDWKALSVAANGD